jgi:hypothetical protein
MDCVTDWFHSAHTLRALTFSMALLYGFVTGMDFTLTSSIPRLGGIDVLRHSWVYKMGILLKRNLALKIGDLLQCS